MGTLNSKNEPLPDTSVYSGAGGILFTLYKTYLLAVAQG
jgi:hypothetical protein